MSLLSNLLQQYIDWATQITPEHKVMLWGFCLLMFVVCLFLANFDELTKREN